MVKTMNAKSHYVLLCRTITPLGSPEARRQYLAKNIFSYEKEGFEFLLTFFPKEDFTTTDIKEIEKKLKSKVSDTRNKAVRILLTLPYSLRKHLTNACRLLKETISQPL